MAHYKCYETPAFAKAPLAQVPDWLGRVHRWLGTDKTRRALAEIDDAHVDELSEIGRRLRREARRELGPIGFFRPSPPGSTGRHLKESTMSKSRLPTLLIASLVAFSAAPATANGLCTPAVTFKEVRFSHHASHRTWTGTLAVDASPCAASTGLFELSLVRQKETAPDLGFVEHATWRPGQVEVAVALAIDESISDYGIRDIAPCACRD